MQLGFTIAISPDGLKAEVFRESAQEPGPLLSVAETAELVAVVLGTVSGGREEESSAEVVLCAYRQAGVTALMRLRGDFALTLWDARERRLLALRDPCGGYPLFWAERQAGFVLATALSPLAAMTGKGAFDRVYLGAFLCASEVEISELDIARTAYEGLARVPPGVCLAFMALPQRVDRLAVWSWEEEVARTEVGTWPEAVNSFHERLDRSVRSRLRGRVAAHLSGGMDSTSLCALASRALGAHTSGEALHTLSLVFARSPALAAETRMIERALAGLQAIPHRLPGDAYRPFAHLDLVPRHDEPHPTSLWIASEGAMVEVAAMAGCRTILSGSGGDFALDVLPFHLADRLARLQWGRLITECAAWAEGATTSFRAIFWSYALRPLLRGLPGQMSSGAVYRGAWARYDGRRLPPWLRPDFVRRHDPVGALVDRDTRHRTRVSRRTRVALALVRAHRGDWSRWYLAAPKGIAIVYPFLDPETVVLALAASERLPADPFRLKPLLADAMGGLLPEAIRTRRRKIDYNEAVFTGLGENLGSLERLVSAPALADLGIVEPTVVLACLRRTALGVAPLAAATNRLNKVLALALWLDRQLAAPQAAPAVVQHVVRRVPGAIDHLTKSRRLDHADRRLRHERA